MSLTQGQLLEGLRFRYIENFDYTDNPLATFHHKDTHGEWMYELPDLIKLTKQASKLGISNDHLDTALVDLKEAQDIFDRIVEPASIHSFYS